MNDQRLLDCPEESLTRWPQCDLICVLLFAAFLCFWGTNSGPALSDHEAIVAQGARQIRQGDGWLLPKVGEQPFVQKPPLAFWLSAVCSKVFESPDVDPPVTELAARLPAAFSAFGTACLVYLLGRAMFGHRIGIVAATTFVSSASVLFFSHNAQVEMVQTFLATACYVCFWFATEGSARRALLWIAFYVSLALAMLAKMPQPLATVGLPLAAWWLIVVPLFDLNAAPDAPRRSLAARAIEQVVGLRRLWLIPGVLLFLALFLPWPWYVWKNVHGIRALWQVEFIDRYTGDIGSEGIPYVYYIPVVFALMVPFSLSVPEAFISPFLRFYRNYRKPLLFAFTWAVVQIAFLSTSAFKRPRYILGAVPAIALLLGPTLDRLFLAARSFSRRNVGLAVGAILVSIGGGLLGGGVYVLRRYPESFWMCPVAAGILMGGLVVACVSFFRGSRLASLLALHATVALVFAWAWTAMGQGQGMQWAAHEMLTQMRAHSIGPDDEITWVTARPDAALMFYLGGRIKPLFSVTELAERRGNRTEVSRALLQEGMDRLLARLDSRREEYFIIRGGYWDNLKSFYRPSAREVFRVVSRSNPGEDDYVMLTNPWNTRAGGELVGQSPHAEAPTSQPTATSR